ncbi:hypothetical protein [Paenibacillus sp. XY044]|uniref:hypothetical protein n=1 Tax=Paenibacillus sp. XY044 TaxID=2026089 RepID=UPI00211AC36B|nr:hypothetical protein [Paenibacillus sp. XY044]
MNIHAINSWIRHLAHNYFLIVIAAVVFFLCKAVIGYFTYRHYNKKLEALNHKLDRLSDEMGKIKRE